MSAIWTRLNVGDSSPALRSSSEVCSSRSELSGVTIDESEFPGDREECDSDSDSERESELCDLDTEANILLGGDGGPDEPESSACWLFSRYRRGL